MRPKTSRGDASAGVPSGQWTLPITSAVFGLMHMSMYGAMAAALLQTFAMGAVLAILRARSGSIVPCILAHAVLNVYATAAFLAFAR